MVGKTVMSEENRFFSAQSCCYKNWMQKSFVYLGEIRVTLQVQFCSANLIPTGDASASYGNKLSLSKKM